MSQGFVAIASGESELQYQALLVASFQFIVEQQSQELQWSQVLIHRLGNAHIQGVEDARESELA
jgi:hypothetical protein